jgi:hypothetical protein
MMISAPNGENDNPGRHDLKINLFLEFTFADKNYDDPC